MVETDQPHERAVERGQASPAQPADLAVQVARLFYDDDQTKVQIAARLGISRFRVARLIEQAHERGLVRIEFPHLPERNRSLAHDLEERYGLDLCAVAAGDPIDGQGPARLARLAGSIIGDLLRPDDVVGIAWGSTLAAVVREVPPRSDPTLIVVQLAGSSTRLGRGSDPAEVSRVLADRLGAAHRGLFAPALVESAALRSDLAREPDIADTIAWFDRLTMAIVGIGAMPTGRSRSRSSLVRSGVFGEKELEHLRGLGAVGDLVVHPFDADGRFVEPAIAERAIAIELDRLAHVPRVVAVAGGLAKGAAIRGALASGLIDVLVTDEAGARSAVAGVARVAATRRSDG